MKIKNIILSFLFLQPCIVDTRLHSNKSIHTGNPPVSMKFDFGSSAKPGYKKINSSTFYNDSTGFGFEPGSLVTSTSRTTNNAVADGFVTSKKPYMFSIKLPEGSYNVVLRLGDIEGISDMAVRAECRRMMIERVVTKQNEIKTVEFTVHIRDTLIRATGNKVKIKSRERDFLHWDNKLTLEFNGVEPKLNTIEINPANSNMVTIFLAGNSTVVDQDKEPYAAWGQMIPAFFEPQRICIANYAESGESLNSFIAEKRFEKVLSLMNRGDYAFIEFGHNDQKQRGEGIGAFTSYKKDLRFFIAEVRHKGGIPVLITSMHRRHFDTAGHIIQTLGDYPEAVRQTAKEENVALIDLNAMSKVLYEAWGPDESKKAFVIYPANSFPGQRTELNDNTHFNPYGAYEIARCIVNGIRQNNLGIAKYLKKDLKAFDPAKPDPVTDLYWPLSPLTASKKPDGN
ncbi:MAG: rhamnogalacturonan acetylesterase [Chitinophagaceae bacterium]|nr:rhamnogalacturonan acetylesterase [Chitinophagaceae bacterium]